MFYSKHILANLGMFDKLEGRFSVPLSDLESVSYGGYLLSAH